MSNWRTVDPAPSRLEEGRDVYGIALEVARALDRADLDLWAAGIRACLDAPTSLARQEHLTVELVRLRDLPNVRRAGCGPRISGALARLQLGLGTIDVPLQPLYTATRDLADHLELTGGRRWLLRLRAVIEDPDRPEAERLERLASVISLMVPGADGLPEGSTMLVRAVGERLGRRTEPALVLRYLTFALRTPAASRAADRP